MTPRYTVVWDGFAQRKLAELWLNNPAIRRDVTNAVNEIDGLLSQSPATLGIPALGRGRIVVRPPVSVLFLLREDDRQVRVLDIKFWDE
jgi:hypothetical protein